VIKARTTTAKTKSSLLFLQTVTLPESLAPDNPLWECLPEDERDRALRYRFERDRACFVTMRSLLRQQLSERLDTPPQTIRFTYNAHGKPELAGNPVYFNIAHTQGVRVQGIGVLALHPTAPVGVDIERWDRECDHALLRRRVFAPEEDAHYHTLSDDEQRRFFYTCWTSKEAYTKALGVGLQMPFPTFAVAEVAPYLTPIDCGADYSAHLALIEGDSPCPT
jgi:4'-phosphopantetheinyl transferase